MHRVEDAVRSPRHAVSNQPRAAHRGIVLMEVLVALSVFAVASIAMFAAFKTAWGGWQVVQQMASEQQAARTVLDRVSRRIRMIGVDYAGTDPPVVSARTGEITFWASGQCHRIYVSGGVVYHQAGTSCGSGTARPVTPGWDARQLTVTRLAFRYFNAATEGGAPIDPVGDTIAAADLPTIKRIEITVSIRGNQAPFALSTQAVIRNGR